MGDKQTDQGGVKIAVWVVFCHKCWNQAWTSTPNEMYMYPLATKVSLPGLIAVVNKLPDVAIACYKSVSAQKIHVSLAFFKDTARVSKYPFTPPRIDCPSGLISTEIKIGVTHRNSVVSTSSVVTFDLCMFLKFLDIPVIVDLSC